MPRVLSFQVDDETERFIDHDMDALRKATGEDVSVSQYLRMLIHQRLKGGNYNPEEAGWGEGFRSGAADFQKEFQTFLAEFTKARLST